MEIITITYGKAQKWRSRKEAIAFFKDAVYSCEGAERERYVNVFMKLLDGKTVCTDDD